MRRRAPAPTPRTGTAIPPEFNTTRRRRAELNGAAGPMPKPLAGRHEPQTGRADGPKQRLPPVHARRAGRAHPMAAHEVTTDQPAGRCSMLVAEAVGRALVAAGVDHVFGVVGSGNFHATNAMVAAGARFVAARHEGGAATMADAYARTSGRPAALSVHQGCGLTNAMTGIGEAAKSRTPLVVLAAEATNRSSNFFVDQDALARSVGAVPMRIADAQYAVPRAREAVATAVHQRRTVVLNLPLEVQAAEVPDAALPGSLLSHGEAAADLDLPPAPPPPRPSAADIERLVAALRSAQRPGFGAGRGARSPSARDALVALAESTDALLATSAVAKGLFHDNPWTLDVSGGFSSPLAAELIGDADLIIGWGCALNMW